MPWPFSFRELLAAAEAKREEQWQQIATIRSEIYHSAFGRKGSKPLSKFNPLAKSRRGPRLSKEAGRKALDRFFGFLESD